MKKEKEFSKANMLKSAAAFLMLGAFLAPSFSLVALATTTPTVIKPPVITKTVPAGSTGSGSGGSKSGGGGGIQQFLGIFAQIAQMFKGLAGGNTSGSGSSGGGSSQPATVDFKGKTYTLDSQGKFVADDGMTYVHISDLNSVKTANTDLGAPGENKITFIDPITGKPAADTPQAQTYDPNKFILVPGGAQHPYENVTLPDGTTAKHDLTTGEYIDKYGEKVDVSSMKDVNSNLGSQTLDTNAYGKISVQDSFPTDTNGIKTVSGIDALGNKVTVVTDINTGQVTETKFDGFDGQPTGSQTFSTLNAGGIQGVGASNTSFVETSSIDGLPHNYTTNPKTGEVTDNGVADTPAIDPTIPTQSTLTTEGQPAVGPLPDLAGDTGLGEVGLPASQTNVTSEGSLVSGADSSSFGSTDTSLSQSDPAMQIYQDFGMKAGNGLSTGNSTDFGTSNISPSNPDSSAYDFAQQNLAFSEAQRQATENAYTNYVAQTTDTETGGRTDSWNPKTEQDLLANKNAADATYQYDKGVVDGFTSSPNPAGLTGMEDAVPNASAETNFGNGSTLDATNLQGVDNIGTVDTSGASFATTDSGISNLTVTPTVNADMSYSAGTFDTFPVQGTQFALADQSTSGLSFSGANTFDTSSFNSGTIDSSQFSYGADSGKIFDFSTPTTDNLFSTPPDLATLPNFDNSSIFTSPLDNAGVDFNNPAFSYDNSSLPAFDPGTTNLFDSGNPFSPDSFSSTPFDFNANSFTDSTFTVPDASLTNFNTNDLWNADNTYLDPNGNVVPYNNGTPVNDSSGTYLSGGFGF